MPLRTTDCCLLFGEEHAREIFAICASLRLTAEGDSHGSFVSAVLRAGCAQVLHHCLYSDSDAGSSVKQNRSAKGKTKSPKAEFRLLRLWPGPTFILEMERKVDNQLAAPAETRTPNLHRARSAHEECGWKGGDSGSSVGRENLVQRKNNRTHLTPTGLLMEGHYAQNARSHRQRMGAKFGNPGEAFSHFSNLASPCGWVFAKKSPVI